jgi:hypothetical protein
MNLPRCMTRWTLPFMWTMLVSIAPPAVAQEEMSDVKRELAALRAEVQQLRAELESLKAASPPAALSSVVEIVQTQVAELAQTKVESTMRFPVRLFGTVHAGIFTNSANANWLDIPNLVLPAPADGHAGTFSASLRQTRLGFTADGPRIDSMRTSAVVAMDFFGGLPGFQTAQVMGLPRLLVAFARVEGERTAIQVGQDHVMLAPRDPTSLAGFAFPLLFRSGNLYLRAPQFRVEHAVTERVHAAAGIVAPVGGDFTGTEYVFVPPPLGGERSRRPAVEARVAYRAGEIGEPRSIDLGVSGHTGWERRGNSLAHGWAAAVDLAGRRDRVGVAGELYVGANADAVGAALGLDARSRGGWGELQAFPSDRVSLTAGVGVDDIRDARRFALPRRRNQSAYGSIIVSLTPEVQTALEYRRLRTFAGTASRSNHHVDWVFVHKF